MQFAGNVVELSFYRLDLQSDMEPVKVPAKEILKQPHLLEDLQKTLPELKVQQVTHEVKLGHSALHTVLRTVVDNRMMLIVLHLMKLEKKMNTVPTV